MKKLLKKQDGFTLAEVTAYVAVATIITVSIIAIIVQLVQIKLRADTMSIMSQEATCVFEELIKSVRNCDSFTLDSPHELTVVTGVDEKDYFLQDGRVMLNDGLGLNQLTSNQVVVTDITFTDRTTLTSDSLLIIDITLSRGDQDESYQTSVQVR